MLPWKQIQATAERVVWRREQEREQVRGRGQGQGLWRGRGLGLELGQGQMLVLGQQVPYRNYMLYSWIEMSMHYTHYWDRDHSHLWEDRCFCRDTNHTLFLPHTNYTYQL